MTEKSDDREWRMALRRSVAAKKWMDSVQRELNQAEDEYHQACRALDELENGKHPHT